MKVNFELKGAAEFGNMLDQLPKAAKRLGANAVRAGIRVIAAEAKKRVPVASGDLKKSIKVAKRRPKTRTQQVYAAAVTGKEGPLAHLIEFGSDPHMIKAKEGKILANPQTGEFFGKVVQHPGTSPQPFLRPAADTKAKEALEKMGENLGKGIEREANKALKKLSA